MSPGEKALDGLIADAHLATAEDLPDLLGRHLASLGAREPLVYLADLQQRLLVPLLGREGAASGHHVEPLPVDSTLAGRSYQHIEIQSQAAPEGLRVWLPLLDGTERLGVVAVTVDPGALSADGGLLERRLQRVVSLTGELVMTRSLYGDTMVRLRRRAKMGIAAEIQWSLLPPLTFANRALTVSAALEPAYHMAGDTVDYAVDAGRAHLAVFDGMGHGLQSAQLAVLSVGAYRSSRRAEGGLAEAIRTVDQTLGAAFGGEAFATAVLAELDTESGTLRWVNAGHPEPLLLRDGKIVKSLYVDPAVPLGLGEFEPSATEAAVGEEQLEPGDRVLLYTDGVVEARSPDGEFFGIDRLVDLIVRSFAGGLPAPETMRRVVRALLAHQGDQLTDDASLLLVEWHG